MSTQVRVVIVEDALLVREGLQLVLASAGIEVCAVFATVEELFLKAHSLRVDAVLLDIQMPPSYTDEGLVALETIRARGSRIGVLLLSAYLTVDCITRVRNAGPGTGYLMKDRVAEPGIFARVIQTVASGGCFMDPEALAYLVRRREAEQPLARLSGRERTVLEYMAQGYSNQGIADQLVLGVKTIESHITAILTKLDLPDIPGVHRRVQAVLVRLATDER
ncbi:MAG: hypothetical protein B5766_06470 [Candidatus Lumbricidophila eiseniae]|uniref:DNA-binding response regulator n=1 Tax=Candidatus Lumbricidiphila eiseniae TaxID=1969409 RepID=A0A2A6FRE4_9MICO|nr:MAG: hypothetical protein B5766_06470 [Candidatus Lumbricidophila eiseniae]